MFFLGFPAFGSESECSEWLDRDASVRGQPLSVSVQPQYVESVADCDRGSMCLVTMASGATYHVPLGRQALIEGWSEILNKIGRRQQLLGGLAQG